MDINDITKEQLEVMDDDELMYWHGVFQRQSQAVEIRKAMLGFIEVRDANGPRIIKIDSKVAE